MVIIYLLSMKDKKTFNTLFSSITTDIQDKYLPIVNSDNRSSHEIYLKNPNRFLQFIDKHNLLYAKQYDFI